MKGTEHGMWLRRQEIHAFGDDVHGAPDQYTCADHAPDCALRRGARAADAHRAFGPAVLAARDDRAPAGMTRADARWTASVVVILTILIVACGMVL
jgi:hypothetical protein